MFNNQVILLDHRVIRAVDALAELADQLILSGNVKPKFKQSVIEREVEFPTGLETKGFGVAIPHSTPEFVNESQIAFMRLSTPVSFHQMGTDTPVLVKYIFMLAIKESEVQPEMLKLLMTLFNDDKALSALARLETKSAFLGIMSQIACKSGVRIRR